MHAYDRTLIARLGFDDPDKKDGKHDLVCQYLAECPGKLLEVTDLPRRTREDEDPDCWEEDWIVEGHSFEFPISKGVNQYRTTIGFLDLVIRCQSTVHRKGFHTGLPLTGLDEFAVVVEVKVNKVSIGDILRQVALYREYRGRGTAWVLATTFPMTAVDLRSLGNQEIVHVFVGERFNRWVADRAATDVPEMMEI